MSPPSSAAIDEPPSGAHRPSRGIVVSALGIGQILAWGSTYYLPAVLAPTIAADLGLPLAPIVGGLTVGLVAASLVSPRVGRAIEATGGRTVLAFASLTMAAGLGALAFAQGLVTYLAAWLVIGIGMGAGLYDAAFSTLGKLYGREARAAITNLTLFGGFASTVCWPLSAFLVETLGWRGTCLAYAAIHVCVTTPIHLRLVPRLPPQAPPPPDAASAERAAGAHAAAAASVAPAHPLLPLALAAGLTIGAIASATLSVHIIGLLQERGTSLAAAVALAALIGPAQVGARVIEAVIGRRFHPIYTAAASTMLTLAGIVVLALGLPLLALGLVLYGAGIGIRSIVRGTLPLALFGQHGYAALMGRLALPQLLVGALAPLGAAFVIDWAGADVLLAILVALCVLDLAFVGVIAALMRR